MNVVAGLTVQKDTYSQLSAGATDFPTDYIHYLSAGTINSGTHLKSEWSMVSLLARANYVYDNKYMLTATVRRGGSSRFGAKSEMGNISFCFGWVSCIGRNLLCRILELCPI